MKSLEMSLDIQCTLDIVPVCSCGPNGPEGFPDMVYNIEGSNYFIPRDSYVISEYNTCYLKIMHHPSLPFHIMGLNFFQNYYTVFDQEQGRLGFAPSIHASSRLDDLMESHQKLLHQPNEEEATTQDASRTLMI